MCIKFASKQAKGKIDDDTANDIDEREIIDEHDRRDRRPSPGFPPVNVAGVPSARRSTAPVISSPSIASLSLTLCGYYLEKSVARLASDKF